jgi:pantoate--beta-alanine ligase
MITVTTGAEMRRRAAGFRAAGERIGFVPTMGALHAGHLALVERARGLADRVVASVFVNPEQFDDPADLERYPRQPEEDARLLAGAGVDVLFLPPVEEVYPPGDATAVVVRGPAEGLEGAFRPGHFQGVATVVARLFHLVAPDLAVFGEKDAQQLAVVRRMVADLHVPVDVVAHPTVREEDGLALSSRNAGLDPAARRAATVLFRALAAGRQAVEAAFAAPGGDQPDRTAAAPAAEPEPEGVAPAEPVRAALRRVLAAEPAAEVEYAEVVDAVSFQPLDRLPAHGRIVLPLAARLGGVRLIDNLQLDLPPAPAGVRSIDAAGETSPPVLS